MEMKNDVVRLGDAELNRVAGGMDPNLEAAYAVMQGRYSDEDEKRWQLEENYVEIQRYVKGLSQGYDVVARDVMLGRYGNGPERTARLRAAGYDAELVQDIVDAMSR